MKIATLLSSLLCVLFISTINAQENKIIPCDSPEYHQFDFWLGDWEVFDTTGKLVGTNKIVRMTNGCVLQENWKSESSGYAGTSYNYYDQNKKTWNQLWVDNQGASLELTGKFSEGKMILKSELKKGQKVALYYDQINWELQNDGSVVQLWEIFDDKGKLLQTAFKGIYRKKK